MAETFFLYLERADLRRDRGGKGTLIAEPGRIPEKAGSGVIEPGVSRPAAVFLKEHSVAGQSSSSAASTQSAGLRANEPEQMPLAGSKQLWTGEVDQLFAAAFEELR